MYESHGRNEFRITHFESHHLNHTLRNNTPLTHIESHSQNSPKSHTLTHIESHTSNQTLRITQSQFHNASGHSTQGKATGDLRTSQSYRRRLFLRGGERGKYACAFQLYMCIDLQAQHTQGRPSRKLLAVQAVLGSAGTLNHTLERETVLIFTIVQGLHSRTTRHQKAKRQETSGRCNRT